MKTLLTFFILLLWLSVSSQSEARYEAGITGGLTAIPFFILTSKTSSGTYLGGFLRRVDENQGYFQASLDYGKTSNLRLQNLQQDLFILPEQILEITSITNLTAYSELRLSLDHQPHWLRWKRFRFNCGVYAGVLTSTDVLRLSNTPEVNNHFALTDELRRTPGARNHPVEISTAMPDYSGQIVLGWRMGVSYPLPGGPEFKLGFHSDLTNRFVILENDSDARLYQVRLGFTAPIKRF